MYKTIKTADKAIAEAELKLRMVDLLDSLVEVKENLVNAKNEILDLREENSNLKISNNFFDKLELKPDNHYYAYPDLPIPKGPYCASCYLKKELALLVKPIEDCFGKWECTSCGVMYKS